ncbi:MAG: AAA family ATPase [bacterium]|nr:AAA family ATPase [bacterium]
MLTKITIKNFKRVDTELDLSSVVVFVGPNNSGKTSALQAIALWEFGLRKWVELKKTKSLKAKKRTGVPINRKDLYNIPVPSLRQFWRDLQVRKLTKEAGKQDTKNITIQISIAGNIEGKTWDLGLEFDFFNAEACYVRPLGDISEEIINTSLKERVALLPPMSGLSADEYKLELGTINVFIGQGKTADVLRNLCWYVFNNNKEKWNKMVGLIKNMFGLKINEPELIPVTARIVVTYTERQVKYDLINGGRGFHQVLLLLSYIYANPGTIVLIDEPDAHLEILRQKQVFNILCELLKEQDSQLIIATHSEALLNEAAEKADIIAFLGRPHIINKPFQLIKSLTSIGFEQYLLSEQKGWVLYLEGSTDMDMLKAFAKILNHPVLPYLEKPFTKYVSNKPEDAKNHFYGLREGVSDLKGITLYDRVERELKQDNLYEMMWQRREIENYLPLPEVIERYFVEQPKNLFTLEYPNLIKDIIQEEVPPAGLKDKNHDFWINTKISDEFLDKIFRKFAQKMKIAIPLSKKNYYVLAQYSKAEELSFEVKEKLDKIYEIAEKYERK